MKSYDYMMEEFRNLSLINQLEAVKYTAAFKIKSFEEPGDIIEDYIDSAMATAAAHEWAVYDGGMIPSTVIRPIEGCADFEEYALAHGATSRLMAHIVWEELRSMFEIWADVYGGSGLLFMVPDYDQEWCGDLAAVYYQAAQMIEVGGDYPEDMNQEIKAEIEKEIERIERRAER